ncbi:efflux RND transporter periplasmic adaptor subunit [Candidatus Parcubacteria bacterium]|nr:efflux RND transporter periplasmic adaptor subunit [Candidatus Parcubacteria bacterium]MCK5459771.1 efflux RND transporter periplasmic adaptor subunit [Candidatus Parcubacteria bacterium]
MKNLIINKAIKIIGAILIINLIIFGYIFLAGKNEPAVNFESADENIIAVQTYKLSPKTISSDISLSGTAQPMDEVIVSPKVSGKVVGIYAREGEEVGTNQILIQLEQDSALLVSYNNAQSSITNTIASANQDISAAELTVAATKINLENIKINAAENTNNSKLTIESAQISMNSAKKSLINIKNTNEQTIQNAYDNIKTTMQSNLTAIKTALTAVGNIIGESPGDPSANNDYKNVLGAKKSQTLTNTKNLFFQAKNDYETSDINYNNLSNNYFLLEIDDLIDEVGNSLNSTRETLVKTKILLDNTITTSDFTSVDLNALKTSIDANLASIQSAISSLQANQQTIINAKLADVSSSDTAQSAYETAQSALDIKQQALILAESQSKSQIDAVQKQLELTQINLEGVKKRADQQIAAAQGQLDYTQAQLNNTTIPAPISGIVNQIFIDSGEMAAAGNPVASIVNTSGIKIELSLTEFDIGKVAFGQETKISCAAYPDEEFVGNVYYISSVADSISKKFPIKIQLDNKDEKIKAGMIASLEIITKKQEYILAIPKSAIFIKDGLEKVYTIGCDNKIIIKTIKTEIVNNNEVKIVEGLSENDIIVIEGNYELKNGDIISVSN